MHRKRVRVASGEKLIVHNVREFFEKKKEQQRSIKRNLVIERTAMATGLGTTTLVN